MTNLVTLAWNLLRVHCLRSLCWFILTSILRLRSPKGYASLTLFLFQVPNVSPQTDADARFAIGEAMRLNGDPSSPFVGRLDVLHVGLLGHSFGGAAALEACHLAVWKRGAHRTGSGGCVQPGRPPCRLIDGTLARSAPVPGSWSRAWGATPAGSAMT